MIYTITLNPALDHFLDVDEIRVNDANRVRMESLYAGGKGIDVSRAISHLGGESMALGFIGGHNGQIMVDLLKQESVTCYFTPIAQETRRNVIVTTKIRRSQTILNARGPLVTAQEWRAFLRHLTLLDLSDSYVVMSGSLPRGIPPDAYWQIIRMVQSRGGRAILDSDGPAFKMGLKARPFAIKPNVNELRRLIGRPVRGETALLRHAAELSPRSVEIVLISRGRAGLLAVKGAERWRAVPPSVTVRSTVGAGDSAVAGFVHSYASGKGLEDSVRYATAAGTAATLAPGNQLCRRVDVERLVRRVKLTRL